MFERASEVSDEVRFSSLSILSDSIPSIDLSLLCPLKLTLGLPGKISVTDPNPLGSSLDVASDPFCL
eukprot:augustus_masked-scaffold_55-processed-gene-1.55-mRNA-1 protein AED:1.00 eAED:1.00 QI:0/-1/0/0/-1/1/1/0/66